jgi:hypothetical protein
LSQSNNESMILKMSRSQDILIKDRFIEENSRFLVSQSGKMYPKKPKHKNYLTELRSSNILKKEKQWDGDMLSDKKLDPVKEYHKVYMDVEKQDELIK